MSPSRRSSAIQGSAPLQEPQGKRPPSSQTLGLAFPEGVVQCYREGELYYEINDREERTTRPPFRILKEFEADGVTPKVDSKKEEIFIMKNNAQGEQVYQYDVLHDERRLAAAASSGVADPAPVASTPSPSSSRRPYHDSSHLTGTGDSPLSEPEPSPEPTSVALPIPKSPQNRRRTRGSGNDNLHPPPPPPAAPTAESAALWMSASASSSNKFRTKRSRSEAAAEAIDAKDEAAPDASKSESARLRGCVDEAPVSDVPSTDAPATSSSLGSETIKSISSVPSHAPLSFPITGHHDHPSSFSHLLNPTYSTNTSPHLNGEDTPPVAAAGIESPHALTIPSRPHSPPPAPKDHLGESAFDDGLPLPVPMEVDDPIAANESSSQQQGEHHRKRKISAPPTVAGGNFATLSGVGSGGVPGGRLGSLLNEEPAIKRTKHVHPAVEASPSSQPPSSEGSRRSNRASSAGGGGAARGAKEQKQQPTPPPAVSAPRSAATSCYLDDDLSDLSSAPGSPSEKEDEPSKEEKERPPFIKTSASDSATSSIKLTFPVKETPAFAHEAAAGSSSEEEKPRKEKRKSSKASSTPHTSSSRTGNESKKSGKGSSGSTAAATAPPLLPLSRPPPAINRKKANKKKVVESESESESEESAYSTDSDDHPSRAKPASKTIPTSKLTATVKQSAAASAAATSKSAASAAATSKPAAPTDYLANLIGGGSTSTSGTSTPKRTATTPAVKASTGSSYLSKKVGGPAMSTSTPSTSKLANSSSSSAVKPSGVARKKKPAGGIDFTSTDYLSGLMGKTPAKGGSSSSSNTAKGKAKEALASGEEIARLKAEFFKDLRKELENPIDIEAQGNVMRHFERKQRTLLKQPEWLYPFSDGRAFSIALESKERMAEADRLQDEKDAALCARLGVDLDKLTRREKGMPPWPRTKAESENLDFAYQAVMEGLWDDEEKVKRYREDERFFPVRSGKRIEVQCKGESGHWYNI